MTQKNAPEPLSSVNRPASAGSSKLPPAPFLYPILDSAFSQAPLDDAKELIRAGIQILQLRCKNYTKRKSFDLAQRLLPLCLESGVTLVINDIVDIALLSESAGIHLGQEDFPVSDARVLLGSKIIGFSTHNPEQYFQAQRLPVDYVAIGPVFSTITKSTETAPLGLSFTEWLYKEKSKPVVCIGGVSRYNARSLIQAGADGVAAISAFYRESSIYDAACRFLEELNRV